jgi:hypothetical protein
MALLDHEASRFVSGPGALGFIENNDPISGRRGILGILVAPFVHALDEAVSLASAEAADWALAGLGGRLAASLVA